MVHSFDFLCINQVRAPYTHNFVWFWLQEGLAAAEFGLHYQPKQWKLTSVQLI